MKSCRVSLKQSLFRHRSTVSSTVICAAACLLYPISNSQLSLAFSTLSVFPLRRQNTCYINDQSSAYFDSININLHHKQQTCTRILPIRMTSSTPHDEIVKAMAVAAEMRKTTATVSSSSSGEASSSITDTAPLTIFDKLISGDIPCNKVYEDDIALAFHDVNPVAPVHILVIPKNRDGLTQISKATSFQNQNTIGHCMMVASQIGKQYCKDGFRLVVNDGEHGGQSVYHLHIHVMGGRQMQWPPG